MTMNSYRTKIIPNLHREVGYKYIRVYRLSAILLVFCCLSLATFAQKKGGNIYAMVVGVSQYSNPQNNLSYSHKDAAQVYKLLQSRTTSDKAKMLLDNYATRANILTSCNDLFTKSQKDDILIFYFSGHGSYGGMVSHDAMVSFDDLKTIFKSSKAKHKIIIVDACHSGDMRTPSANSSKTPISPKDKVCLFLSSRTYQYSFESSQMANGYFTYYLLAGLRGGADANKDKIVTAKELYDFVTPWVKSKSENKQIPVMWGKFDNNMAIMNWNNN